MDSYLLKIGLVVVPLILLVLLWLVWKFFSKLFKYFVVAFIVVAIGAGIYLYRMIPHRNPAVGKHAYLTESGKYLGVVEGSGQDNQRGDVWIVRPPGRYPVMYGKSRVTLKDRREIEKEPKEEPSQGPSPSPNPTHLPKAKKRSNTRTSNAV